MVGALGIWGGPSETCALVDNSQTTRDHGTLPTPCCPCPGSQTTASAAIIPTVRLGQELPASLIFVPMFNLASTREESRMCPQPGLRDAPLLVACLQPPPSPSLHTRLCHAPVAEFPCCLML